MVNIQIASQAANLPDVCCFEQWVAEVLKDQKTDANVCIRIVDEAESAQLNNEYRHKQGPTNVLSFPFAAPAELAEGFLGDIIICAPIVAREAVEQHKSLLAHWAHMTVHGVLHLLGFDHIVNEEATDMENLETTILINLGFDNPYGDK